MNKIIDFINKLVEVFKGRSPLSLLSWLLLGLLALAIIIALIKKAGASIASLITLALKYLLLSPFYILFLPIKWPEKLHRNGYNWCGDLWVAPVIINAPLLIQLIWLVIVMLIYVVYIPFYSFYKLIKAPKALREYVSLRRELKAYYIERAQTIRG